MNDEEFKVEHREVFDSIDNIVLLKRETDTGYTVFNRKRNIIHTLEFDNKRVVSLLLEANVPIYKDVTEIWNTELVPTGLIWDEKSNRWIELTIDEIFRRKAEEDNQ